MAQKQ
jgi:target of rapamycin complex subunit LST8